MRRVFIGLLVFLFVIVVGLAAAHFHFPYRAASMVAVQALEKGRPYRLEFKGPEAKRPGVYEARNVALDMVVDGRKQPLTFFERVTVKVKPLPLLSGELAADFVLRTADGSIQGSLSRELFGDRSLTVEVKAIDLPDFIFTDPEGRGVVQGHLTGQMTVLGEGDVAPTGGGGEIQLTNGRISDVTVPDVPLTELDIQDLELAFELDSRKATVKRLDVTSSQGAASVAGRVVDLKNPRLDMTGSARMGPAEQPLVSVNFKLTGSPVAPRIRITSSKGPGF